MPGGAQQVGSCGDGAVLLTADHRHLGGIEVTGQPSTPSRNDNVEAVATNAATALRQARFLFFESEKGVGTLP